jgi:predicted kinase
METYGPGSGKIVGQLRDEREYDHMIVKDFLDKIRDGMKDPSKYPPVLLMSLMMALCFDNNQPISWHLSSKHQRIALEHFYFFRDAHPWVRANIFYGMIDIMSEVYGRYLLPLRQHARADDAGKKQSVLSEDSMKKTLIILRGLPGSGKTTFSNFLGTLYKDAHVISLDDFRIVDGEYVFDVKREREVVEAYKTSVLNAFKIGADCVILDNTHSRLWEFNHWVRVAEHHKYSVFVLDVEESLEVCLLRGTHSVPEEKVREMSKRWEKF